MADLKLKKALIRNWAKFDNVDIEFPEQGLIMVTGMNRASGGALQSVGCHVKGQRLLTYSGALKAVENVAVRDRLMGPDSKPRTVLKLCRGKGKMYRVVPIKGTPFIVNEDHVLALYFTNSSNYPLFANEKINISVKEFLTWNRRKQRECKLYHAPCVHFLKSRKLPIEPRILGMWLGDGSSDAVALTTADSALEQLWIKFGHKNKLHARYERKITNKSATVHLTGDKGGNHRPGTKRVNMNPVLQCLKRLKVYNNKHIPQTYKTASRNDRLELLAGLIDTDGSLDGNSGFSYTSVSKQLIDDVSFVARSLGLTVTKKPRLTNCQTKKNCLSYRIHISGNCAEVPVALRHKSAAVRKQKKRHNVTGFKVEPIGFDDFFGFQLDKDGLYLLDDFTVTHNSGKTAFGEAISRTLLGADGGRFAYTKEFSTDEAGDTYVRIEATFLDKPLIVELGYKCKEMSMTGEALRFSYDGSKPVERGLIKETRAELTKLIGVPPMLAKWTVFVDGDNIKFNKLSQSDSVELVMSALRQPPWNEYHEHSKKAVSKFKQLLAKDEQAHTEAAHRLEESEADVKQAEVAVDEEEKEYSRQKAQNTAQLKTLQANVEQRNAQIEQSKQRQTEISKQLKKIEKEKSAAFHDLEIKRNDLNDRIGLLEEKREELLTKREETFEEQVNTKNTYQNYENSSKAKTCPTCKRPMASVIDPAHMDKLKKAYQSAENAHQAAQKTHTDNETKIKAEVKIRAEIIQKLAALSVEDQVTELSEEYEKLEDQAAAILNAIHQQELKIQQLKSAVLDTALKTAQATHAERVRVRDNCIQTVATSAATFTESQATMRVLDYWNTAFSPYGIPNMVLKEAIHPLNKEAKRVSAKMTGGTIDVVYSTRRELASGLEKAELVIEVKNTLGSKKLAGSSKGEAGLANLVIAETLAEVGQISRRVGYRWYDEVVPHQDPVVCKSIYAHLREVAHKLGILIFMVDHNPVAADYADHILVVEKSKAEGRVFGKVYWG